MYDSRAFGTTFLKATMGFRLTPSDFTYRYNVGPREDVLKASMGFRLAQSYLTLDDFEGPKTSPHSFRCEICGHDFKSHRQQQPRPFAIFGDFCDNNVCACTASTYRLLYFWSHIYDIKWIQRPRFPKRREDFTCKPTFRPKGTLSELVKKRKLHLFFSLAKWIYVPNLIKIRREMGALSWAKPGANWRLCAFTTFGIIGHRTRFLLSHVWLAFQIWGRSDKNCGRYREW